MKSRTISKGAFNRRRRATKSNVTQPQTLKSAAGSLAEKLENPTVLKTKCCTRYPRGAAPRFVWTELESSVTVGWVVARSWMISSSQRGRAFSRRASRQAYATSRTTLPPLQFRAILVEMMFLWVGTEKSGSAQAELGERVVTTGFVLELPEALANL
jgi:hypothetical protein